MKRLRILFASLLLVGWSGVAYCEDKPDPTKDKPTFEELVELAKKAGDVPINGDGCVANVSAPCCVHLCEKWDATVKVWPTAEGNKTPKHDPDEPLHKVTIEGPAYVAWGRNRRTEWTIPKCKGEITIKRITQDRSAKAGDEVLIKVDGELCATVELSSAVFKAMTREPNPDTGEPYVADPSRPGGRDPGHAWCMVKVCRDKLNDLGPLKKYANKPIGWGALNWPNVEAGQMTAPGYFVMPDKKNKATASKSWCITFENAKKALEKVKEVAEADPKPEYHVTNYNCVGFVVQIGTLAGAAVPNGVGPIKVPMGELTMTLQVPNCGAFGVQLKALKCNPEKKPEDDGSGGTTPNSDPPSTD